MLEHRERLTQKTHSMNNTDSKFVPASQRRAFAQTCACGKPNTDGKYCVKTDGSAFCHSCGKYFPNPDEEPKERTPSPLPIVEKPATYHDIKQMDTTLKGYDRNNLITFMQSLLPEINVSEKAKSAGIGSSNHYGGNSTVFWQIDEKGNIRGGKIIKYNPLTGKRIKESTPPVSWVHSTLRIPNFTLKQCLFGAHLLKGNTKPVSIVESEKTAFLMSLIDANRIWVATGGKENLKYDLLKVLKGRKITAHPDNGEFEHWKEKADTFSVYGITIKVSKLFQGEDKPKGWDIADEVIKNLQDTTPEQPIKRKSYEDYTRQERLMFGMQHFKKEDLQQLANDLFLNCREMAYQPMTDCLGIYEGLNPTDASDILDLFCLNNILSVTDQGYTLKQRP